MRRRDAVGLSTAVFPILACLSASFIPEAFSQFVDQLCDYTRICPHFVEPNPKPALLQFAGSLDWWHALERIRRLGAFIIPAQIALIVFSVFFANAKNERQHMSIPQVFTLGFSALWLTYFAVFSPVSALVGLGALSRTFLTPIGIWVFGLFYATIGIMLSPIAYYILQRVSEK